MADPTTDLFEMRRLESLSNTIFGVAMTLLANDLPEAGEFKSMPTWSDLGQLYSGWFMALGGLLIRCRMDTATAGET